MPLGIAVLLFLSMWLAFGWLIYEQLRLMARRLSSAVSMEAAPVARVGNG